MRNFNNFITSFESYAKFMQVPEKYARWCAISVVAGALERKTWLTNGGTIWYPNLYIMLVGDAGVRKSTTANLAIDLLRQVPDITFLANRVNGESMRIAMLHAGRDKKFNFNGKDYPHSAVYLFGSEAATTFTEMYQGGEIITALTDVFNCEPLGWNDKIGWSKRTMKDGEINICNPCVNLLACTTSQWLASKIMKKSDAEAGFGSRLLLVVHSGQFKRSFGWNEVTQEDTTMKIKLIEDLREIAKISGSFKLTHAFKKLYKKLDEQHAQWAEGNVVSQLLSGYVERKLTQVTKLSMVISAARNSYLCIDDDDLQMAWDFVTELEPTMLDAYKSIGTEENSSNRTADEIMAFLLKKQRTRFTRAEVITLYSKRYPFKVVINAINALLAMKRLKLCLDGAGMKEVTYEIIPPSAPIQNQLSP